MIILEVCANSVQSAIEGQKGGATRVELCNNLAVGGITPSIAQIEIARKLLDIELNVLIRPREGDFFYNDLEFEIMKNDIHHCGKMGCDGVVIGILNSDKTIDIERNEQLVKIARQYNMSVTFHKAFDCCVNLMESLEIIVSLGCDRILTSGGRKTVIEGRENLKELIIHGGNKIVIMPGGGITENNIYELVQFTNLKEFHGSFKKSIKSEMNNIPTAVDELYKTSIFETDSQKVKDALLNTNKV